jgi:hypothetical protein
MGPFYFGRAYQGSFFLQGDESELGERVMRLIERAGLCPKLRASRKCRMIEVRFYLVGLLDLLPDGWALLDDTLLRARFFSSNCLYWVGRGLPFFAGLLDGDGHCTASLVKARWARSCVYGVLNQWRWDFVQSKFPFLVDYMRSFLQVVSPKGGFHVYTGRGGFGCSRVSYHLCLTKPAISALLGVGVARFSWKAARWQRKVSELQRSRSSYTDCPRRRRRYTSTGRPSGVGSRRAR